MMVGTNITLSFASSYRAAPRRLAPSDAIDASILSTTVFHATVHPTAILHAPAPHSPRETSLIDTIICIIFLDGTQASSKIVAVAWRRLMAHANINRMTSKLCIIFLMSPPRSVAIDGRILQRLSSLDGSGGWCWWRK